MPADDGLACQGHRHRVLVAVAYPPMRQMLAAFLERDTHCWSATSTTLAELAGAIDRHHPDVVIVGAAEFPRCCQAEFGGFPAARVVVIGHEPDRAYRAAAFRGGAGGWVAADAVGDELNTQLSIAVACERARQSPHGCLPFREPLCPNS